MLAYNDTPTFTFVFLYEREALLAAKGSADVGKILSDAGFVSDGTRALDLDLGSFAATGEFENPQIIFWTGDEAFLECKVLDEFSKEKIELQLGSMQLQRGGVFSSSAYTPARRDQLVNTVEQLAGLDGFDLGFSLPFGKDEDEDDYREWFSECVHSGRFSLSRLIVHEWLCIQSLALRTGIDQRISTNELIECPSWRVSTPREEVVCLFFDDMNAGGMRPWPEGPRYTREAFKFLRERLTGD